MTVINTMCYIIQNNMEENKVLSKEEFEDLLQNNHGKEIINPIYPNKYKSFRRALRRGHITPNGTPIPRRPFNNRKPTAGRKENELKKTIYNEYKEYLKRTSTE